jgi:hypothetical protein
MGGSLSYERLRNTVDAGVPADPNDRPVTKRRPILSGSVRILGKSRLFTSIAAWTHNHCFMYKLQVGVCFLYARPHFRTVHPYTHALRVVPIGLTGMYHVHVLHMYQGVRRSFGRLPRISVVMDGFEVIVVFLLFLFNQVCVRKLRNVFVRVLSLDHESMCCTPQLPARIANMPRRKNISCSAFFTGIWYRPFHRVKASRR